MLRDVSLAAPTPTRRHVLSGLAGVSLFGNVSRSLAEVTFPTKPITLILPGLPGGAFDFFARPMASSIAKSLGQPLILDHKPGGTMTLGPATMAVNAKPDGHTLSIVVSTIVRIPLMQKVAFDPFVDFTHIIQLCEVAVGVVTHADQPFKSIADVVAYAKDNPGKLTYGTPGTGSGAHFGMEQMARKAGIRLTHVPFRGAQEGVPAVLGKHVAIYISASEWKPQVLAGELRVLGVMSASRRPSWPDAPTFDELGYPSGLGAATFGIVGPKGMDAKVVSTLHDAFKTASEDPAVRDAWSTRELVPNYRSGPDYRRHLAEIAALDSEMVVALGLQRKD
jgi:tripartite-type tricarboxylate transporter receptor subunit TctC